MTNIDMFEEMELCENHKKLLKVVKEQKKTITYLEKEIDTLKTIIETEKYKEKIK